RSPTTPGRARLAPLSRLAASCLGLPRIVAAEPPQVALGIATCVTRAAVLLLRILVDDLGTGGHGALVVRLAVRDDHARTLRLAAVRLVRLHDVATELVVAHRADHDHAVAEHELGMRDAAVLVVIHRVLRETECLA